jgi:acetoacetyl-[acyl-carrier protein] synthase
VSSGSRRLPVIVGFGGINAAGRASFHHAYRRLVIDALDDALRARTYASLARLMNLDADPALPETRRHIDLHTLVRRIELFDVERIPCNRSATLKPADPSGLSFLTAGTSRTTWIRAGRSPSWTNAPCASPCQRRSSCI